MSEPSVLPATPAPTVEATPAPSTRSRHRIRRALLRLTFLSVATVLGLLVLLWLGQRVLIYPGASMEHPPSRSLDAGWETWSLPLITSGSDDDLAATPGVPALFRPGQGVTAQAPGPAVVFLHGNAEIIQQWAPELQWYCQQGLSVLIPEYRGFGSAAGEPSQSAITGDLQRYVDRLAARDDVDPDRLIYHGRSMGGGFAAQLLRHRTPAALILASSFTSYADAAADMVHVPTFLIRDPLPVTAILRDYTGPTLILHGTADRVVQVEHARRNAAAAQNPTLILYPDTGHNTMPRGHGDWADIADFLAAYDLLPTAQALPPSTP